MTESAPQPSLRLLIVEDHTDSARALARLFRHEGHTVITAHTMSGALALVVGQQPVDVVLSDISLPDGDGCELLRRLRAFYGGRDVPALALSGLGDDETLKRCREVGFRKFLLKPLAFEQVRDEVLALAAPHAAAAAPPAALITRPLGGVPAPLPVD
jgi:two-component system CheB/CheR fusion protein